MNVNNLPTPSADDTKAEAAAALPDPEQPHPAAIGSALPAKPLSWQKGSFLHSYINKAGLSLHAFRLYFLLRCRANVEGKSWAGIKSMASDCGCNRNLVMKATTELEERRMIRVTRRHDGSHTNSYQMTAPEEWTEVQSKASLVKKVPDPTVTTQSPKVTTQSPTVTAAKVTTLSPTVTTQSPTVTAAKVTTLSPSMTAQSLPITTRSLSMTTRAATVTGSISNGSISNELDSSKLNPNKSISSEGEAERYSFDPEWEPPMSPEELAWRIEEEGYADDSNTEEETAISLIQDCVDECFRRGTTNWKQREMALIKEIALDYTGDECQMDIFCLGDHVKKLKSRYNSVEQRRYTRKCAFDLLSNWEKEINLADTFKD